MRKAAIHSITAPGPAVEDLAADAGYKKPSSKAHAYKLDETPQTVHPMVELAMKNKLPELDSSRNLSGRQTPQSEFLLPPKTTGNAISMNRLSALSQVADCSSGEKPKSDLDVIPGKGGDVYARSGRQSIGSHRNVSSLEQAKYASFARAEVLSSLFRYRLSKAASDRLGEVLTKAALGNGYGNFPQAGQTPIPRDAHGTRAATTTGVITTDHVGTRKPDGSAAIENKAPLVQTPATNALMTQPVGTWLGKAGALVRLVKVGMHKSAILDYIRASNDKKAALLTIGRLQKASEQERATAKLAGLMRTYELAHSDGKGAMPSGPDGPVPTVLTKAKTQFASNWCNRLDPFSRKVPLARVMGRQKGNV